MAVKATWLDEIKNPSGNLVHFQSGAPRGVAYRTPALLLGKGDSAACGKKEEASEANGSSVAPPAFLHYHLAQDSEYILPPGTSLKLSNFKESLFAYHWGGHEKLAAASFPACKCYQQFCVSSLCRLLRSLSICTVPALWDTKIKRTQPPPSRELTIQTGDGCVNNQCSMAGSNGKDELHLTH